jgi:hypothetical protein
LPFPELEGPAEAAFLKGKDRPEVSVPWIPVNGDFAA